MGRFVLGQMSEAAPGEAENNAQPQEKVPSDRALLA